MDGKKEGIGDLYHQETKYRRESGPHGGPEGAHPPLPFKEMTRTQKHFPLCPPDPKGGKSVWEAIAQRRSVREFSRRSLSFLQISQLVWAIQGITLKAHGFDFRASPSAGGLYPIETYLAANRIEEIPSGLYHYEVRGARLILLREGLFGPELSSAGLGQEMLGEAAAVFVWTAVVGRSKWKYRERAYRYIYMDAGHIGQALYLAASALDLGCCTVGAFFDDEVDHLVGVDGKQEISVYLGAVGHRL